MKIQTQGLVIKETNIGEYDKLLFILTAENGIIRAFADGVRRLKNKNANGSSLLCYSKFTLYKAKDTYKVNDCVPIEMFFNLRFDLEALSLAQYFSEMALKLTPEESENPSELLRLILNSLHFLVENKKPKEFIKAITELKIMSLSGYMPNVSRCINCGADNNCLFFSVTDGGILCSNCGKSDINTFLINSTILTAIRHILYADFNKIYSFEIPQDDLKTLSFLTERYVLVQSETNYKTLVFYQSIKEK